ncbi:MAG TPA: PAS domain-containing protein [Actinomycetota bacterium]|nr:PAS domain-containing protein [Actinomycetota bacterium]
MTELLPQKGIIMILARELASKLATATFLVEPDGTLVYYNEPAEKILGVEFAEAGPLKPDEWGTMFSPVDEQGNPLPLEKLPLAVTLASKRPSHRTFRITGMDGVTRAIAVTAIPLFAREDEFVGGVAFFWEEGGPAAA